MKRCAFLILAFFYSHSAEGQKSKYSRSELKELVIAQQRKITELELQNEVLVQSASRFKEVEQLMFAYRSETERLHDTIKAREDVIFIKKQENTYLLASIKNYKKDLDNLSSLNAAQKNTSIFNLQSSKPERAKLISSSDYEYRSERKHYITGPRGGCYYINGNGNKTYVDRSLCR